MAKEHPLDRAQRRWEESQGLRKSDPLADALDQLSPHDQAMALRAHEIGVSDAIEALQTRDFAWLDARLAEGDPSSATSRAYELGVRGVLDEFNKKVRPR
jgi:hypothetical protein